MMVPFHRHNLPQLVVTEIHLIQYYESVEMIVFRSLLNSKDESFICSVLQNITISIGNTFNH